MWIQGLSQDLETGCSKLAIMKFLDINFFQGRPQYIQISTINIYLLNEIEHNIHMQCQRNYIGVQRFSYMLEIDILRNSSLDFLCVLLGVFWGFGCPNDAQRPCWFRLCLEWGKCWTWPFPRHQIWPFNGGVSASAGIINPYNQLIDHFALISDWSSLNKIFIIFDYVLCLHGQISIQKGPCLPW